MIPIVVLIRIIQLFLFVFMSRGPHDTIFINFVDHGTTGLVAFPHDHLYADQLNDAFTIMHSKKSYSKVT